MFGRKQKEIDKLNRWNGSLHQEANEQGRRIKELESRLSDAHTLIDQLGGLLEGVDGRVRRYRSRMIEERIDPAQTEVVHGLFTQSG
jgi:hypothetical protein